MTPNNNAKLLVTFWGTRGSISTPCRITEKYGGNTSCVSVRHQDIHIIFDAGTGIRNLGLDLIEEFKKVNGYPVETHMDAMGMNVTTTTVEINPKKNAGNTVYSVPTGYTKKDKLSMEEMQKR